MKLESLYAAALFVIAFAVGVSLSLMCAPKPEPPCCAGKCACEDCKCCPACPGHKK